MFVLMSMCGVRSTFRICFFHHVGSRERACVRRLGGQVSFPADHQVPILSLIQRLLFPLEAE